MATVSEDLIREGSDLLAQRNAEDIHKLGDRIISAEPDNWYGHYIRGCGYALECDFANCVANWTAMVENLEDDSQMEGFCPVICDMLTHCLTHVPEGAPLDFSKLGELLIQINNALPESDDEVIVTTVLDKAGEYLKANAAVSPLTTYYAFKALVVCSFRAYVELTFFPVFFEKLAVIAQATKDRSPELAVPIDNNEMFSTEMTSAINAAVEGCPEETLEKIEEYWLGHKVDSYLAHILQAYKCSVNMGGMKSLALKLSKKILVTEIQIFIKTYFGAKV